MPILDLWGLLLGSGDIKKWEKPKICETPHLTAQELGKN